MKIIRYILFPFSLAYGLVTAARNGLYNANIFKSTSFDTPVISVGNLTTGGTGKTPHIEYLIRLLKDEFNVATLSRGYGRSVSGFRVVETDSTPRECGDEPLQFKSKFPNIQVAVDSDRVNGIINLFKTTEQIDCILLDDAYQHRAVKPGLNILLTEYSKPWNEDWMLPTGNLREWPIGKKRADLVIVTKCPDNLSEPDLQKAGQALKPTAGQKLFFTGFKYGAVQSLHGYGSFPDLGTLKEHEIVLVTGIANPKPLIEKMKGLGLKFQHLKFPDHHRFKAKDIQQIRNLFGTFGDEKIILTTEKDAQRLNAIREMKDLPVYFISIEVYFINDEASFRKEIIDHVRNH